MQKSDQVLYTTRARVLQAHLRASFPLLDWHVLTWEQREVPDTLPKSLPIPAEMVAGLHRADTEGEVHFVMAPIKLNNAIGHVAVTVESKAFFDEGLVAGSLCLVERISAQLAEVIKGWH